MAEITVIGGINIDIEGAPYRPLLYADSNPGRITMAYGGVGRNITENIVRAGGDVAMLSVIGDDAMGQGAKAQLAGMGVDVHGIQTVAGRSSAMYLSILNHERDMEIALCDMDILAQMDWPVIEGHLPFLRQSRVVALDGNLDEALLAQIIDHLDGVKLFFDPVSAAKASKGRNQIGRFYAIKPNRLEAEVLSGIPIQTDADLHKAGDWFLSQGVKQVYITLNREGVYYQDAMHCGRIAPKPVEIVSATGAGDSFSAMILLGIAADRPIGEIARMGMAASALAMESGQAVNPKMSREEILRRSKDV